MRTKRKAQSPESRAERPSEKQINAKVADIARALGFALNYIAENSHSPAYRAEVLSAAVVCLADALDSLGDLLDVVEQAAIEANRRAKRANEGGAR